MFSKSDIIKEILKTTKENNGLPLGRDRFLEKTGITEYDYQKYWPRFSDAQREAGITPNTMKTAYPDEFLFEKFIGLMREIDRWPVKGDIRVKMNNDSNFPNDKTFFRLGNKQQFAAKLQKYAETKKYSDVIQICTSVLNEFENNEAFPEEINHNDTIGSVYLLKSGRYYKIGRTNSMGRRHHEITILLPDGAELIHEIKTDDPSGIENYWHRRFEDKRKNGEWFDLTVSDVRTFKRWRKII